MRFIFYGSLVLFLFFHSTEATGQRFLAGITAGVNAAQINGDEHAGYNRLGLVAGLRGVTVFSDKFQMGLELLFSQRGSQRELNFNSPVDKQIIHLDYIEVPVVANYLDWYIDELEYYKIHFHAGLSYSYLFNANAKEFSNYEGVIDLFNETDISYLAGITFFINPHIGFTVRYNRSINKLYDREKFIGDPSVPELNSLTPFYLTFRTLYMF